MATQRRQRFIHGELAWMLAAALCLALLDSLTYELFCVVSLIGFLHVTELTAPFKMTLHRISNELVAEARDHECSVIAFEDLTDIRERAGASWGHKWAFNRLYEYVESKAAEYGIDVEQVDPENTSRRCSHCGFTHPDNREHEEAPDCEFRRVCDGCW